jgi:hypothetical protein
MSTEKLKVLVFNPLVKDVGKAVKIVNMQNKKAGPFDFSLFLGDVFPDDINSSSSSTVTDLVPEIPVYFTQGEKGYKKELKLNENLNYLGEIGVYKLANGLKIGYVSGDLDHLTSDELLAKFNGQQVDILISYLWPDAIAREEKLVLSGDPKLDCLMAALQPQYWFACGGEKGRFFERQPYKIDESVTRFISLATMDAGRWWFAFQISLKQVVPESLETTSAPVISSEARKRKAEEDDEARTQLTLKKLATEPSKPKSIVTPENCFLCLSNPKFEIHMIISIAKLCYLTVSKGPLPLKNERGFSGHGMIVPIEHYPTLRSFVHAKDENARVEDSDLVREISLFQTSLAEMFKSVGDYSVVFWEISRKRAVHGHVQFVPVPNRIIPYFQKTLKNQIRFDERFYPEPLVYKKFEKDDDLTELNDIINREDYVLFTLYERFGVTRYIIPLGNDDDKYFDPQFPRKVVAVLLNLKNRIHWNKCIETQEQESIQKAAFQDAYRDFDIMRKTTE